MPPRAHGAGAALLVLAVAMTTAAAEEILEPLTDNLLVNGGPDVPSMDGWSDVVSGGDGWAAHIQTENCSTADKPDPDWPRECERVFKTSYQPCTRRQVVSLETGPVTAAMLDGGLVAIVVAEEVREFYAVDKFFIRAALCRDEECKHKVARWAPCKEVSTVATEVNDQWCLTQGTPGKKTTDDVWRSHNYTFGGAEVAGARYLLFEDGGVDSEYWQGLWGPWFRSASVVVHKSTHSFAPTATPAPTPKPRPTPRPTPLPTFSPYSYAAAPTPRPQIHKPNPHHKNPNATPQPTTPDPFGADAQAEASTSDVWMYVAFALMAIITGFAIGYCIRAKRRGAGGAASNPYAIAGTALDDDDEGLEMRGGFV